jgi:hypothetical protein
MLGLPVPGRLRPQRHGDNILRWVLQVRLSD